MNEFNVIAAKDIRKLTDEQVDGLVTYFKFISLRISFTALVIVFTGRTGGIAVFPKSVHDIELERGTITVSFEELEKMANLGIMS